MSAEHIQGFRKNYRVHFVAQGYKTLEVTFPYEVAELEARRCNMSVEDFLKTHYALAEFGPEDGVHYTFIADGNEKKEAAK